MASLILAAAPPAHLRALAPDALDAPDSAQRAAIEATIARRTAAFAPDGAAADLAWPLQPAPDFDPFDYHGTGYFVDHDPRFPGFLQDYTCGARTYDLDTGYNHAGTDYYLWPYPWLMMDQEQVRIVAAAPGVIVEKIDGNFDRDCAIAGNGGFNTPWNWHLDPDTVSFPEVAIELCDGCPRDVEAAGVSYGAGTFCPWTAEIVAEQN